MNNNKIITSKIQHGNTISIKTQIKSIQNITRRLILQNGPEKIHTHKPKAEKRERKNSGTQIRICRAKSGKSVFLLTPFPPLGFPTPLRLPSGGNVGNFRSLKAWREKCEWKIRHFEAFVNRL